MVMQLTKCGMYTVSVAGAKAHLSGILTKVEAGREIIITRRGQAVAKLSAVRPRKRPIDFAALDALCARQRLSRLSRSRVQLIRRTRDAKY
jgi:prevent-host-death family protein